MNRLRCATALALTLTISGTAAYAAPPATTLSAHDFALLNRVTWGASGPAAEALARDGTKRWLDQQLNPAAPDVLPEPVQAQIEAMTIVKEPLATLAPRMDAQQRAANQLTDPEQKKQAQQTYQQAMQALSRQAAARSLLRDLYSPNQVREQMTWFWFNQFNVHLAKRDVRAMIGDYEDQAIRPHALGRFRDLLEATLKHPAMLRYLDNDQNGAARLNENYAREIMELHTMGVGSGYSQEDVQQLARILTGVGVNLTANPPKLKPEQQALYIRDGLFEFNPARHDFGDKVFLGHTIKGSGFAEVEQALDILSHQPATARRVSTRLAQYFIGDAPLPALIDRMAATFTKSDGDIAQTLRTLFASKEFDASLGKGFKDPQHYVVSAVRLAYGDRVVLNTTPMQNWLNRLGEGLFNHETPDGYSLSSAAWTGPGQMAVRFEIARQIGSGSAGLFRPEGEAKDAPAFPQPQNALFYTAIAPTLAPATDGALGQAASPQEWNTLFLSSPEFMRR